MPHVVMYLRRWLIANAALFPWHSDGTSLQSWRSFCNFTGQEWDIHSRHPKLLTSGTGYRVSFQDWGLQWHVGRLSCDGHWARKHRWRLRPPIYIFLHNRPILRLLNGKMVWHQVALTMPQPMLKHNADEKQRLTHKNPPYTLQSMDRWQPCEISSTWTQSTSHFCMDWEAVLSQ